MNNKCECNKTGGILIKEFFNYLCIKGRYTVKLTVYELEIFINKLISLQSFTKELMTEENVNEITKIGDAV